MLPAQQGLDPAQTAIAGCHLWLKVQHEFIAFDGVASSCFPAAFFSSA